MFSDRYMLGDERFYPISGDKWVTNTLKNINSSRPQASPWWGRMQSKGPVILAQLFFLEGGEEVCAFWDFFMFPMCSHNVLNMFTFKFSMCSHNVLNVFPQCSQCILNLFPMRLNLSHNNLHRWEPKGTSINITILGVQISIEGGVQSFRILFLW
jgi:hypothetical protein